MHLNVDKEDYRDIIFNPAAKRKKNAIWENSRNKTSIWLQGRDQLGQSGKAGELIVKWWEKVDIL